MSGQTPELTGPRCAGSAVAGSAVAGSAVVGFAAASFSSAGRPTDGAMSTASRLLFSGLSSEISSSPTVVDKKKARDFIRAGGHGNVKSKLILCFFCSTEGIGLQARTFIRRILYITNMKLNKRYKTPFTGMDNLFVHQLLRVYLCVSRPGLCPGYTGISARRRYQRG